jgi:hypothetical protein
MMMMMMLMIVVVVMYSCYSKMDRASIRMIERVLRDAPCFYPFQNIACPYLDHADWLLARMMIDHNTIFIMQDLILQILLYIKLRSSCLITRIQAKNVIHSRK